MVLESVTKTTINTINETFNNNIQQLKGKIKEIFKEVYDRIQQEIKNEIDKFNSERQNGTEKITDNKELENNLTIAEYNSKKLQNAANWTWRDCAAAFGCTFRENESKNDIVKSSNQINC
jgi:uncharacterized protein YjbJ (UPF0337 family)